jgi:hypothetical protein
LGLMKSAVVIVAGFSRACWEAAVSVWNI